MRRIADHDRNSTAQRNLGLRLGLSDIKSSVSTYTAGWKHVAEDDVTAQAPFDMNPFPGALGDPTSCILIITLCSTQGAENNVTAVAYRPNNLFEKYHG